MWSISDIEREHAIRGIALQPEGRWWLKKAGTGHFFGLHTHLAWFNAKWEDNRYQTDKRPLAGAGISYGYKADLSAHWESKSISAGYANMKYDTFYRERTDLAQHPYPSLLGHHSRRPLVVYRFKKNHEKQTHYISLYLLLPALMSRLFVRTPVMTRDGEIGIDPTSVTLNAKLKLNLKMPAAEEGGENLLRRSRRIPSIPPPIHHRRLFEPYMRGASGDLSGHCQRT